MKFYEYEIYDALNKNFLFYRLLDLNHIHKNLLHKEYILNQNNNKLVLYNIDRVNFEIKNKYVVDLNLICMTINNYFNLSKKYNFSELDLLKQTGVNTNVYKLPKLSEINSKLNKKYHYGIIKANKQLKIVSIEEAEKKSGKHKKTKISTTKSSKTKYTPEDYPYLETAILDKDSCKSFGRIYTHNIKYK